MTPPVILLGAGGHAKVVLDLLRALDRQVLGVCDPRLAAEGVGTWRDLPVLGGDKAVQSFESDSIELANGVGSMPNNGLRRCLHGMFTNRGYQFATLVHPSAMVGSGVTLGAGVQLMAGAIVQADTHIGESTILNTAASVDHDGVIGAHVHIAPGAVLSGQVAIGEGAHIGSGATIIQGISLGVGAVIGAGTVVIRDVPAQHQQTGQPPRRPQPLV